MLEKNLQEVEQNIQRACERAKRSREEVTLIAVSKTKPISMLKEIYDLGIQNFGENKVQELTEKYPKMPEDTTWHLIGHLLYGQQVWRINSEFQSFKNAFAHESVLKASSSAPFLY